MVTAAGISSPSCNSTPEIISDFSQSFIASPEQPSGSNTSFDLMHVSTDDMVSFMDSMDPLDPVAAAVASFPSVDPSYMNMDTVVFSSSVVSPPPPPSSSSIEHHQQQQQQPMVIQLSPASTTTPPTSQVPSPSIHGNASAYGLGVMSSLQSALDPAAVPAPRSRSGTLSSPNSIPGTSIIAPGSASNPDSFAFPSLTDIKREESPLSIGGTILDEIVKSASAAASLCKAGKGAEASRIVGDLGEKLAYVSDVISGMSDLTMTESKAAFSVMGGSPEYFPPPISLAPIPESPLLFPPGNSSPNSDLDVNPVLPVAPSPPSDATRKRCASEIEADRPVKALKSEPQEDILYPTSSSQPPSRPTTPNRFVFNPMKLQIQSQPQPPSQTPSAANFNPYSSASAPPLEMLPKLPAFPPTLQRSAWSESVLPTRHSHSLSTGSINLTSTRSNSLSSHFSPPKSVVAQQQQYPHGRMTRSGSIGTHPFTFSYAQSQPFDPLKATWSPTNVTPAASDSSSGMDTWGGSETSSTSLTSLPNVSRESLGRNSPPDEDEDGEDGDDDSPSGSVHNVSGSPDIPQEYRQEVDRIFFEFLNRTCSNLDATDSKGDPIHQTLMPKKMQRLDESPDFRPFKFRIQAFTTGFLEELARQGYGEEKIPMKRVRNYLWRNPFIQRFNEDGKKAKSKGNYIWNVEAKKTGDGGWEFRPFHRKLAGTPPGVAYCGLKWHWTPHVWDPQASFSNIPVYYSSPSLPSWLSWKGEELSGVPPLDAQSCDIVVNAKFILDGQEGYLAMKFHLNIAPRSAVDPSYSLPRSQSDTLLHQAPVRAAGRNAVNSPTENTPARVVEVLQNVAQRVTEEATAQPHSSDDLQDLVQQKQAVEQSIVAYDRALTGPTPPDTHRLAIAAQQVVAQAAQSAVAQTTGGMSNPAPVVAIQTASVGEMANLAQGALAVAVKMQRGANNLDVIQTTCSLLAHQRTGTAPPHSTHMTGVVPSRASIPNGSNPYPHFSMV